MSTTPEAVFHYEIQKSGDETTGPITTIVCHGKVVSETSGQVKEVVKPLIPLGGHIVLDLTDVSYVDSSGLGTQRRLLQVGTGQLVPSGKRTPSPQ
jgi:anti-anti-sigma factor